MIVAHEDVSTFHKSLFEKSFNREVVVILGHILAIFGKTYQVNRRGLVPPSPTGSGLNPYPAIPIAVD